MADDGRTVDTAELTLSQIRVIERRDRVRNLMARRLIGREIARALSVSERTIDTDIAAIRLEMNRELKLQTVMDVAADIRRRTQARERELWLLFQNAKGVGSEGVKLAVLRQLRESEAQELKQLQGLGLVEEAPKKIQAEVRMLAALEDLPAAMLAELAEAPDLEKKLQELLGTDMTRAILRLPPGDEVIARPEAEAELDAIDVTDE